MIRRARSVLEPRHEGPYYGHALRAVIAPEPRASMVERITDWWHARRWPAVVICVVAIGAVVLGFLAAM